MKKAVIFDLDGTLYDKSKLARRLIWSQLLRGKLLLLKREREVRRMLRGRHFDSETDFYDTFFLSFLNPDNARKWYMEEYMPDMVRILRQHYHVADWVGPTFRKLRQEQVMTVVFSDYGCVREKLEAIGFNLSWADYLFDAPSLGGLKPCVESFERIAHILQLQPEECLMVGDREDTDYEGARSVGMDFEFVRKAARPKLTLNPKII